MIIKNDKLKKLLEDVGELVEQGREKSKEVEKFHEEINSLQMRVQKKKEKMKPLVAEIKKELGYGEFEDFAKLEVIEGEIEIEKIDKIEEHKKFLRELEEKHNDTEQDNEEEPKQDTK